MQQRGRWHLTPVLLPGKSHGRRSLEGCSPWGHEELDRTERLHFHFSLSCIGEGNGKPLQCSCLENPRERGAWWAAVYGVTQSWTQLKRLSIKLCRYLKHWYFLMYILNTLIDITSEFIRKAFRFWKTRKLKWKKEIFQNANFDLKVQFLSLAKYAACYFLEVTSSFHSCEKMSAKYLNLNIHNLAVMNLGCYFK